MRRADVIAIALAVAAGVLGYSAGTGPLAGGIGALILAGIAVRARSAHYIVVWAVAPLLFWATYPDPVGVARCGRARRRARSAGCSRARERPSGRATPSSRRA